MFKINVVCSIVLLTRHCVQVGVGSPSRWPCQITGIPADCTALSSFSHCLYELYRRELKEIEKTYQ